MASGTIQKALRVVSKNVTFTYANYNLWSHDADGIILVCRDSDIVVTQTVPSDGRFAKLFNVSAKTLKPSSESPYTVQCQVLEY